MPLTKYKVTVEFVDRLLFADYVKEHELHCVFAGLRIKDYGITHSEAVYKLEMTDEEAIMMKLSINFNICKIHLHRSID